MPLFKCPHPSHGDEEIPLKSNNDKVYECDLNHRFYRKEGADPVVLADLISSQSFTPEVMTEAAAERPRLNFMTDVPRVVGNPDFNELSLPARQWKLLAKVDGRNTIEEVRLLSGLKADEAEALLFELMDAGLVEIRGKR